MSVHVPEDNSRLSSELRNTLGQVLNEFILGPIVKGGELVQDKLFKPRIRAQTTFDGLTADQGSGKSAGEISPRELERCAVIIAAAFLNPMPVKWDSDRYADAVKMSCGKPTKKTKKKQDLEIFFEKADLGVISELATVVDRHGRILLWYLPNILAPERLAQLNLSIQSLKPQLLRTLSTKTDKTESWRLGGFADQGNAPIFGCGKLSISPGTFMLAHQQLVDPIVRSQTMRAKPIQGWLESVREVEGLFTAILAVVHPDLHEAGLAAHEALATMEPEPRDYTWPSVYSGIDIIANRLTPAHRDQDGAATDYDWLISLGEGHDARLNVPDIGALFFYKAGTGICLAGRMLEHEVPKWTAGERVVIAHYMKDKIHDRLGTPRPCLPTQMDW